MESISLGYAIVAGRKRVPRVAAGITAFTDSHHTSPSSSSPSALLVAPPWYTFQFRGTYGREELPQGPLAAGLVSQDVL